MDFIRFLETVQSHCSCVIMSSRFPRFASLNDSVKYYFFLPRISLMGIRSFVWSLDTMWHQTITMFCQINLTKDCGASVAYLLFTRKKQFSDPGWEFYHPDLIPRVLILGLNSWEYEAFLFERYCRLVRWLNARVRLRAYAKSCLSFHLGAYHDLAISCGTLSSLRGWYYNKWLTLSTYRIQNTCSNFFRPNQLLSQPFSLGEFFGVVELLARSLPGPVRPSAASWTTNLFLGFSLSLRASAKSISPSRALPLLLLPEHCCTTTNSRSFILPAEDSYTFWDINLHPRDLGSPHIETVSEVCIKPSIVFRSLLLNFNFCAGTKRLICPQEASL